MAPLPPGELAELLAESDALLSEVAALCRQGQRGEALQHARRYQQHYLNDPRVAAMRKCLEGMGSVWAEVERVLETAGVDAPDPDDDLCDSF